MEIRWIDDYRIKARYNGKEISSDNYGDAMNWGFARYFGTGAPGSGERVEEPIDLSKQLKDLAEGLPGEHIHYDEFNCLEEGSVDLIIEKTE